MSIKADEQQLGKIFTLTNYQFWIPGYQRPYAWQKDQALELLDDLINAFPHDQPDSPDYFLGSIILIKEDGKEQAEVIDGQQRLTTLILLMSIIRHLLPTDHLAYQDIGDRLQKLSLSGSQLLGLKAREEDELFFAAKVRDPGGIAALVTMDAGIKTDSQRLLRDNAQLLIEEIKKNCPEDVDFTKWLVDFYQQMLSKCYLVVVSTGNFDTAYRIFSTINTRGLNLEINDILKAEIIGAIQDPDEKKKYTAIWDREEKDLGRDDFKSLFSHIQRIKQKEKPKNSLLKEYRNSIKPQNNPIEFIDKTLKPCSDALEIIRDSAFKCDDPEVQRQVNNLFMWLNHIDNSDWLPPAIYFLVKNPNKAEEVLDFFTYLERLAVGMMILRLDINRRLERYRHLFTAIEQGASFAIAKAQELLTLPEQQQIVTILDGDIYTMKRIRLYILLRLDSALADAAYSSSMNIKPITIEHVLPQTLSESWKADGWTEELQQAWVHRLGNLALLSGRKNSEASNYSFKRKVNVYFLGKKSNAEDPNKNQKDTNQAEEDSRTVIFPLTTRIVTIAKEKQWTPDIVQNNQKQFLHKLKAVWQLF
jgi:hypothetical protein